MGLIIGRICTEVYCKYTIHWVGGLLYAYGNCTVVLLKNRVVSSIYTRVLL